MVQGVNSLHLNNEIPSSISFGNNSSSQEAIFDNPIINAKNEIDMLESKLDSIQEENGCFSKAWDGIKAGLNVGTSSESCQDAIQKYKNGEISFDEAMAEIEKYDTKQDNSLNLFSNIATGVAAIGAVSAAVALTAATGGLAVPVLAAIGAGTGAVTKAAFKFTDRATNQKENDALDAKQIARDMCSGAVTGATSAMTMGTAGSTFTVGASLGKNVASAATKCAITGVKTGAISGASNYAIDCAFDENKDFNMGEFVGNTVTSAAVGGAVGGIMGSANTVLRHTGLLHSGGQAGFDAKGNAVFTSKRDMAANMYCTTAYKGLNRGIRDIFAGIKNFFNIN